MPKRTAEEKIKHYREKIKRIEEKKSQNFRRLRVIDSDSDDKNQENETSNISCIEPTVNNDMVHSSEEEVMPTVESPPLEQSTASSVEPQESELDPDLLQALGEIVDDTPEYGQKIHESLSKIWLALLKKGLEKDNKEKILKNYPIPENCKLLQAPKLNAEISAAVPEIVRNRDKSLMAQQQQLGSGITAINRGLDTLLRGDDKKEAIQHISNGCRILSDLHAFFTQNRVKLLSPSLDRTILHVIQNVERDDTLFGKKLSESIKAAKTIQRQGQQIKKTTNPKPSTSFQPQGQRNYNPGNWIAPPRFPSNRGNRGGRRGSYPNHRTYPNASTTQPTTNKSSTTTSRPRATT